ncbi:MAG: DHH family phosphoesterase, partial [archaeon]
MTPLNDLVSPEERPEAVKAFHERVASSAEKLKQLDKVVVVTHHDCDGMTSGSIITKALQREQITVHPMTLKQLYSEDIERLQKMNCSIVFTDFGSSYIEQLKKELAHPFFIIDHHQRGNGELDTHINPMEFGLDGGVESASAGIAYFVAKAYSSKNSVLVGLGVVGGGGDMLDS